jgi:pyruvate/2-oxoglutarate dehydrogenase complex dihydrolipoamide acyltransferase (E2) component
MSILGRAEGAPLRNLPSMRRMLPFLIPERNGAAVYFEQIVDVTRTLAFIEAKGRADRKKVSLFQIVLAAMVRTFVERPDLNRFVIGGKLRQRAQIEFSFAIKRAMRDDAGLTTTKVAFEPDDDLDRIGERMAAPIREGRAGKKTTSDVEMDWFTRLPGFVLRMIMLAQRALDALNLLPAAMIRSDPLYTSMFFTNLGSVGLDSAYHHLFDYGTCPFFVAVGKLKKAVLAGEDGTPVVRDVISIKYSFDERIVDGLYCARSLDVFQRYLEDPARLERG